MPENQAIRALAFDYGLKNIGVAVGQSLTGTAQELGPLRAKDGIPQWHEIKALLEEWQPNQVLVGLPLNMDGTESELSAKARKFANRVHGRFGCAVEMADERLSTRSAKEEAYERKHSGNFGDNPIDSIAARIILESWLRERE